MLDLSFKIRGCQSTPNRIFTAAARCVQRKFGLGCGPSRSSPRYLVLCVVLFKMGVSCVLDPERPSNQIQLEAQPTPQSIAGIETNVHGVDGRERTARAQMSGTEKDGVVGKCSSPLRPQPESESEREAAASDSRASGPTQIEADAMLMGTMTTPHSGRPFDRWDAVGRSIWEAKMEEEGAPVDREAGYARVHMGHA